VLLPRMEAPVAPGTSAGVTFAVGGAGSDRRLQLPQSAILRRGELTGAYVLRDGRLYLRQLRLGEREGEGDDARVEVLSGLKPGDAVVRDPLAAVAALAAQREAAGRTADADGRRE
jgi:hypothetical protein